jgi:hypothetical protein
MMTEKELRAAGELLDLAADEFANHGCNDLDSSFWKGWTEEEKREFYKSYHEWNGDPEEFREDAPLNYLGDSAIMAFLSAKLKGDV